MDDFYDIYTWIRTLLHKSESKLPDDELEPWVQSALRSLALQWPTLPAYADLEDLDRGAVDEAVGFLTAAKMRVFLMKTEPSTEIVRIHTQNTHFQYANPAGNKPGSQNGTGQTIEQMWVASAYAALVQVSVIAAQITTLRSTPFFALAGPRRAQQARGVNTASLSNPLWTVLMDRWDYERQNPSFWWNAGFLPSS